MLNPIRPPNMPEPTTPPPQPPQISLPSMRYPGDGLDCRIPVMSVPAQEIIDLTDDRSSPRDTRMYPFSPYVPPSATVRHSRPPRRVRHVISIDDVDDSVGMEPNTTRSDSPEIEVLFARSRAPSARQRLSQTDPETHRSVPRLPRPVVNLEPENLEDMTDEDNLAVWRSRFQQAAHTPAPHVAGTFRREFARLHDIYQGTRHQLPHGHLLHSESDLGDDVVFMPPQIELPGSLDFARQGFQMGERPPPPPPPTYDPPPKPRSGYSRSPKEDDVLICPNCEDELGVGKDDIKKQVWVAKKCGHVSRTAKPGTRHVANIRLRYIAENVRNIGRLLPNPGLRRQDYPNPSQHVRLRTVTIESAIPRVFFRSTCNSSSAEEVNLHCTRRWNYKGAVAERLSQKHW